MVHWASRILTEPRLISDAIRIFSARFSSSSRFFFHSSSWKLTANVSFNLLSLIVDGENPAFSKVTEEDSVAADSSLSSDCLDLRPLFFFSGGLSAVCASPFSSATSVTCTSSCTGSSTFSGSGSGADTFSSTSLASNKHSFLSSSFIIIKFFISCSISF